SCAIAGDAHLAGLQLRQSLDKREADTEPVMCATRALFPLPEEFKNEWEKFRRDAFTGVSDGDERRSGLYSQRHRHTATGRREFHRVHVPQDLLNAIRVRAHEERPVRLGELQRDPLLPRRLDEGFSGGENGFAEIAGSHVERYLAPV